MPFDFRWKCGWNILCEKLRAFLSARYLHRIPCLLPRLDNPDGDMSGTQKSYKLSSGCGHDPWSVPNLERHGSWRMQISGWLANAAFLNRISICIPSEIARHDLLVLLLIIPLRVTPKGDCPFHAAAPFFAFLFLVHPDAHLV